MTTTPFELDQKEIKERKHWLKVTVSFFLLYPLLTYLFLDVFALFKKIPISEDTLRTQLGYVLARLFQLCIIWRCAYEKQGTRLLTWCLIAAPIAFLKSFSSDESWNETSISTEESWNGWLIGAFIFDAAFYTYWYIFTLKLRNINLKLKAQTRHEYVNFIQSLKKTESIEALDEQFSSMITKWPQFENRAMKEYEIRKTELAKTGQTL